MIDLKDLKYKVIIKKKGKRRGVTKYFSARTFEEIIEYSISYICDRHNSSYKDHFIIGDGPKFKYIVDGQDHIVIEYRYELGINIHDSIDYFVDIEVDNSNLKLDGGIL